MKFQDIQGKNTLKNQLVQQLTSGTIPHAQLFSGAEGSGHLSVAFAWTQYLMCQQPNGTDSCGTCGSCVKVAKLIHPDVHFSFPVVSKKSGSKPTSNDYMEEWRNAVIANPHMSYTDWMDHIGAENKQGNITKEECRSIIQKLSLKAYENGPKVLLIWLPEYLGKEGNSLLKLIEEPPAETYFIFITENIDNILPTILSRTQEVRIPSYTNEEVSTFITKTYPDADLDTVVFLADGDLNTAIHLANHQEEGLGEVMQRWMRLCFRRDVPGLMKWSDELGGKGRENIKHFMEYALKLVREVLAAKTIPEYKPRLNESESEFVMNFSRVIHFANIEVVYDGLNKAHYQIERNANPKLTLFQLSLQIRNSFMQNKQSA